MCMLLLLVSAGMLISLYAIKIPIFKRNLTPTKPFQ